MENMREKVVIVGRPNVGKSSLFNYIVGSRKAIVDATAGVTRDRVSEVVVHEKKEFELIDTGGIGVEGDALDEEINHQIDFALRNADIILFVVDVRAGIVPFDARIAQTLRECDAEVILVANKVDSSKQEKDVHDFCELGFGTPLHISARERLGKQELLEIIADKITIIPSENDSDVPAIKIAIVGRQNVGKSTLVNSLVGEERVIVSEVPGTTRDAIDVRVDIDTNSFILIDTAGLKKKSKTKGIDFYSTVRTEQAVRRCDVALLLIEATSEITAVDRKLAGFIRQYNKPSIIVLNKWDMVENIELEDFSEYVSDRLAALPYSPVVSMSGKEGLNVVDTFSLAKELYDQSGVRVPTAVVNGVLNESIERVRPKGKQKIAKVYYATQVRSFPPTIVCFVNDKQLFDNQYTRYLENQFRKHLPYAEVPIRILYRESHHNKISES